MSSNYNKLVENWKVEFERDHKVTREICGLIVASSFSMIILLISLISSVKRGIILDFGIIFLTISIVSLLELLMKSKSIFKYINKREITSNDNENKELKNDIHNSMSRLLNSLIMIYFFHFLGLYFFLAGLALIFIHFKLAILAYFLIGYIIIKILLSFSGNYKKYKSVKKDEPYVILVYDTTKITLSFYKKYMIGAFISVIILSILFFIPFIS